MGLGCAPGARLGAVLLALARGLAAGPDHGALRSPAWGDGGCRQSFGTDELSLPRDEEPGPWLAAHNHYRACHGAPPLTWDATLVEYARRWSEALVLRCEGAKDIESWVEHAAPGEQRPHDPETYTIEQPQNGENIFASDFPTSSPAEAVESWYREVDTECPDKGQSPGCGGHLNHFTAMIWQEATRLGCHSAVRGTYKVVSCRYAAPDSGGSDCSIPNTQGCDGGQSSPEVEVTSLIDGPCAAFQPPPPPSEEPAVALAADAPSSGDVKGDCVPTHSLGKCDPCLTSDQCGGERYCCPFMKKCVQDGGEKCFAPIAFCLPPCDESLDPAQCTCKNADFPAKWQRPMCGQGSVHASRLYGVWRPAAPAWQAGLGAPAACALSAGLLSLLSLGAVASCRLRGRATRYGLLAGDVEGAQSGHEVE